MPFYTTDTGYTIINSDDYTRGIRVTDTGISIDEPFRFYRNADEIVSYEPAHLTWDFGDVARYEPYEIQTPVTLCGTQNCPNKKKCPHFSKGYFLKQDPNICDFFEK